MKWLRRCRRRHEQNLPLARLGLSPHHRKAAGPGDANFQPRLSTAAHLFGEGTGMDGGSTCIPNDNVPAKTGEVGQQVENR
jgi:hypothetical protein